MPKPANINLAPKTKTTARTISKLLTLGLLLAVVVFVFLNRIAISDYIRGMSYSPTPAMATLRDTLELTPTGKRIFNATYPVLESRDDFNVNCDSHDSDVSVLGCYSNGQIYVYDINSEELSGIRESTTAHELLHAIWTRLSGVEKAKLMPLLESSYTKYQDDLSETIDSYPESEQLDELYVRLATQISELPAELESHYAKFFSKRQTIVEYYNNYVAPFNELKAEIEKLNTELENLNAEIEKLTSDYESRLATFNADAKAFQNCAATVNCFTSEAAFNARKSELISVSRDLDAARESLNALITSYNEKIKTYNDHVLHNRSLQNIINSNSSLENIE